MEEIIEKYFPFRPQFVRAKASMSKILQGAERGQNEWGRKLLLFMIERVILP